MGFATMSIINKPTELDASTVNHFISFGIDLDLRWTNAMFKEAMEVLISQNNYQEVLTNLKAAGITFKEPTTRMIDTFVSKIV